MAVTLRGENFDLLPEGCIAMTSYLNSNPLVNRYETGARHRLAVNVVNKNEIQLTQSNEYYHSIQTYVGAIMSADRETVYWVNETAPLPD